VARFSFGSPPPQSSVYAAIDYETGAYAIATPDGFPLRLANFPIGALRKVDDAYTLFGLDRSGLEMLCVRPKKGAWRVFVTDCASNDRDGHCDGKLTVAAAALKPVMPTKDEMTSFKEHDVVVVIDLQRLDIMVSEVGK